MPRVVSPGGFVYDFDKVEDVEHFIPMVVDDALDRLGKSNMKQLLGWNMVGADRNRRREMCGWRLLEDTTFMKRDGFDEVIPVVGKVDTFYDSVVKPRFNKDMKFAALTFKNFLKPSSTRPLMGSWQKVSVPTWAWTLPSGGSLRNVPGRGPAVVHSPAEPISILNMDGAANAVLLHGAASGSMEQRGDVGKADGVEEASAPSDETMRRSVAQPAAHCTAEATAKTAAAGTCESEAGRDARSSDTPAGEPVAGVDSDDFEFTHSDDDVNLREPRTAYLILNGADADEQAELTERVAFGEIRPADGVFAVVVVLDGGRDLDVAGVRLGMMTGGVVGLADLALSGFDLQVADELELAGFAGGQQASPSHDELPAPTPMELTEHDASRQQGRDAKEQVGLGNTAAWRPGAAPLAQPPTAVENETQTDTRPHIWPADYASFRVRLGDGSPLMTLRDLIKAYAAKREQLPILTTAERVRKEQNLKSAHKSIARAKTLELSEERQQHQDQVVALRSELDAELQRHQAEIASLRAQFQAELQAERLRHQVEVAELHLGHAAAYSDGVQHGRQQAAVQVAALRRREEDLGKWKRIEMLMVKKRAADEQERLRAVHNDALETRAKRAKTWQRRRSNVLRVLVRAQQRRTDAEEQAREIAAAAREEAAAAEADTAKLHAELGDSFKVAQQREHLGTRAAFTMLTVHRDLCVRQRSLNTGAANMQGITSVYSQYIDANGRDLQLHSGSRRSVLRWEKRADVLCLLLEGRELRDELRATPRMRLWTYMDLSPDARAIEQFGMGFEYAGIRYVLTEGEDREIPNWGSLERLSGPAFDTLDCGVVLGPDGCPQVAERVRRIFTPMLEALGPKYAATADCFLRTLQVYGMTPAQLLADDFKFASAERLDIAVPLLDRHEGHTSDGGGEVHKSGGVIDTCTPSASWRHCCAHCLNLALEKSRCFERVGALVRQISSFLRCGNRHKALVHHMKCIQRPELASEDCSEKLRAMYVDAHREVARHGQFQAALGGCDADVHALGERIAEVVAIAMEQLVANATIDKKSKKGTDVRWKYECDVVDERLLDVAHLLGPAIYIEYGVGETYAELAIDEEKQKTATATLALLVDPEFIFWATHMRMIYRIVYRDAFSAVQADGHHAAPALAGDDGLPMRWAAAMRSAVVQPTAGSRGMLMLSRTVCAPLVEMLERHPELGGLTGDHATAAAQDFLDQSDHIERYFSRWRSLEGLTHAVALESPICGPWPCAVPAGRLGDLEGAELVPRVPAASALTAARRGIELFAQASDAERRELPGTLTWLLFSPTTRDGVPNPVFDQTRAFALGEINPLTGWAYPYRCWHDLAEVLVAGGAKYCPSTSAQIESLFTGLTRQQGASKVHISQPQIAFEARCRKNPTMDCLNVQTLSAGWDEAGAVQAALNAAGFWSCDIGLAADRKLVQKLNGQMEVQEASADEDEVATNEVTYTVERIVKSWVAKGARMYEVKWEGWAREHNTHEPEVNLRTCKQLLSFWKSKKNKVQLDRVTELQNAALQELHEAQTAARQRRVHPVQQTAEPVQQSHATAAAGIGQPSAPAPAHQPVADSTPACREAYGKAWRALAAARSLVFSIATSGAAGCVLSIGWLLVDAHGAELAAYERLWRLPQHEPIRSAALRVHGISKDRLARDGVAAEPELVEFSALISAALAGNVRIAAHNASFNVARLNHTAAKHKLSPRLRSADMLCTMHYATRHCGLRKRGAKGHTPPGKEALYRFMFGRAPPVRPLHGVLSQDCRMTLACLMEGLKRKWW